jgi:hypothetical protein
MGGDKVLIEKGRLVEAVEKPRIKTVTAGSGHTLRIIWQHGTADVVDLAPALAVLGPQSVVYRNPQAFSAVQVDTGGDHLAWPDGSLLSAGWVYEMRLGQMTSDEFSAAMSLLKESVVSMASRLGLSKRTIFGYRADRAIPRHVALAVRYLLHKRQPWIETP